MRTLQSERGDSQKGNKAPKKLNGLPKAVRLEKADVELTTIVRAVELSGTTAHT